MEQAFDPYRKWLGIPPAEQPPNHYRLLGLAAFEDDADVIASAADRQMSHVRTFQSGQRGALSQKILNELSAAKICLLNPQKKAEYDNQLRTMLSSASTAPPAVPLSSTLSPSGPVARAQEAAPRGPNPVAGAEVRQAAPLSPQVGPASPIGPASASRPVAAPRVSSARVRRRQSSPAATIAIVAAVGLGFVLVLFIAMSGGGDSNNVPSQQQRSTAKSNSRPPAPVPRREPVKKNDPPPELKKDKESEPPKRAVARPKDDPSPKKTPSDPPKTPETPPDEEMPTSNPPTPPKVLPPFGVPQPEPKQPETTIVRIPAPSTAATDKALANVKEAYKARLGLARTIDERKALARQIIDRAKTPGEDPVVRYALFQLVMQMSEPIVDLETIFEAIGEIEKRYEADPFKEKLTRLDATAPFVDENRAAEFLEYVERVVRQAIDAERFAEADAGVRTARTMAAKTKDPAHRALADRLGKELQQWRTRGRAFRRAEATLAESPDDKKANYIVGLHRCCALDQWEEGLPLLAKSDEAPYAEIAAKELAKPQEASEQAALAEQWLALASQKDDPYQNSYFVRARHWLAAAVQGADDDAERLKIEAKIAEIDVLLQP